MLITIELLQELLSINTENLRVQKPVPVTVESRYIELEGDSEIHLNLDIMKSVKSAIYFVISKFHYVEIRPFRLLILIISVWS